MKERTLTRFIVIVVSPQLPQSLTVSIEITYLNIASQPPPAYILEVHDSIESYDKTLKITIGQYYGVNASLSHLVEPSV